MECQDSIGDGEECKVQSAPGDKSSGYNLEVGRLIACCKMLALFKPGNLLELRGTMLF